MGDERTVSDLLIDQVEFADVIVLNKLDLVDARTAGQLRAALSRFNPTARLLDAQHGHVNPADVLGTELFDPERAQEAPGWVMELNGDHVPETEEYGISSLVFRSDRLFHPERLWTFVTEELDSGAFGEVLRSKGFFRLASRPHVTGLWSQAGSVARFEPSGAQEPRQEAGQDAEQPCQELVFIGTGLDGVALRAAVANCLANDDEDRPLTDPFPPWDAHGVEEPCEHEFAGALTAPGKST